MLNIYTCIQYCLDDLPDDYIDLSKINTNSLADKLDTVYNHHRSGNIYVGFLEPLLMLTQQEEVRIRKVFRRFEVFMVVGNPFILPFSWKNGMRRLVIGRQYQNVKDPETFHYGSSTCV